MTEQTTKAQHLHIPLSELTRKKRRALLGISIVGIAIVELKILPSKISALGIDFPEVHQQPLLPILSLIILYFVVGFVIHAGSDFVAWSQARNQQSLDAATRIDKFLRQRRESSGSRNETESYSDNEGLNEGDDEGLAQLYRDKQDRISALRMHIAVALDLFEFVLPIAVGLYSAFLLWFSQLPNTHT
jgi:hypothetical protein